MYITLQNMEDIRTFHRGCHVQRIFPTDEEFQIIKEDNLFVCAALWELACHFHMCDNLMEAKYHCIQHKKRTNYLFTNLEGKGITSTKEHSPEEKTKRRTAKYKVEDRVLSEDIEGFDEETILLTIAGRVVNCLLGQL